MNPNSGKLDLKGGWHFHRGRNKNILFIFYLLRKGILQLKLFLKNTVI